MCITFFYIPTSNTNEKFILSFNRDENLRKKTSVLGFYEEDPNIVGGRDLEGKGTWCGMNKSTGVVAFLTNYDTENFHDIVEQRYGRGNLTFRFLKSEFGNCSQEKIDQNIYDGLNEILKEINQYNAFNLVVGSIKTNKFYYICNPYNKKIKITPKPELLKQGQAYGLTNTDLHTLWPKSQYGLHLFKKILSNYHNAQTDAVENSDDNNNMKDQMLIQELQELMFDQTMFNEDPQSESSILVQQYLCNYSKKNRGTVSSCYMVIDNRIKGLYKELYLVGEDFNQTTTNPIKTILHL